jgi:hypothetical protein
MEDGVDAGRRQEWAGFRAARRGAQTPRAIAGGSLLLRIQ